MSWIFQSHQSHFEDRALPSGILIFARESATPTRVSFITAVARHPSHLWPGTKIRTSILTLRIDSDLPCVAASEAGELLTNWSRTSLIDRTNENAWMGIESGGGGLIRGLWGCDFICGWCGVRFDFKRRFLVSRPTRNVQSVHSFYYVCIGQGSSLSKVRWVFKVFKPK